MGKGKNKGAGGIQFGHKVKVLRNTPTALEKAIEERHGVSLHERSFSTEALGDVGHTVTDQYSKEDSELGDIKLRDLDAAQLMNMTSFMAENGMPYEKVYEALCASMAESYHTLKTGLYSSPVDLAARNPKEFLKTTEQIKNLQFRTWFRSRTLRELKTPELLRVREQIDVKIAEMRQIDSERERLLKMDVVFKNESARLLPIVDEWMAAVGDQLTSAKGLEIQPNETSRLHVMIEEYKTFGLYDMETVNWVIQPKPEALARYDSVHVFVVRHNWLALLNDSEVVGPDSDKFEDFNLPFDNCLFEFKVMGCPILMHIGLPESIGVQEKERAVMHSHQKYLARVFIQLGGRWAGLYPKGKNEVTISSLLLYLWSQVRAISIMLESEVVSHEIQRAPLALNQKRVKNGKTPLRDYSIIDLARRQRASNPVHGHDGTKRRLHFRRGHWRHYADHKTWIKWMLVGNPELGIVTQRYRL